MEFEDLGKHCSMDMCHQQDFLPYTCSFCEKTFCQEHFRAEAHECKQSQKFAKKAIVCPFCLVTIKYHGSHNETEALDIHQATDCKPEKREEVLKEKEKVLCESGKSCKNKLTDLNEYTCKTCNRNLCLKCRLPEDHICSKLDRPKDAKKIIQIEQKLQQIQINHQAQTNPNILGGTLNHQREYNPNAYQQQIDAAHQQAQNQRREQQLKKKHHVQDKPHQHVPIHQAQSQQHASLPQKEPREVCDVCGKSFEDIMQLLHHAEAEHQNNNQKQDNHAQTQSTKREVCDVCGKSFRDFNELFKHAESIHYVQSN